MSKSKLSNVITTIRLVEHNRLEAHPSFLDAGFENIFPNVNGCGAAGAKFDFVPDTIWGLSVISCCIIHDWDYHYGKTRKEKRAADIRFLVNMILTIIDNSNWIMKIARVERAVKYFLAVNLKGDKAFFGK